MLYKYAPRGVSIYWGRAWCPQLGGGGLQDWRERRRWLGGMELEKGGHDSFLTVLYEKGPFHIKG